MTPYNYLQLLMLTAAFHSAGNSPDRVTVKEGETAILSCDISTFMKSQTSEHRFHIWWVTGDGSDVCDFYNGKSNAAKSFSERATISRNDMGNQYHLTINKTRSSDSGDYFCKLLRPGGHAEDVTTVHLTIEGREKNVSVVFGGALSIHLPVTEAVRLEFRPVSGATQVLVCAVQNGKLREGSAYESRATLRNNELRLEDVTFSDEGSYSVIDARTENIMNTVVLTVEGQTKNEELEEGKNLSIPLCSLNSSHIEFSPGTGSSPRARLCQVENGRMTHLGEEYLQRMAVSNGTLILTHLTTKDEGKYIVQGERGGRAILTLSLKVITIPLGTPDTGWSAIDSIMLSVGVLILVLVVASPFAYKWHRKRKMEQESREKVADLDAGNGSKSAVDPVEKSTSIRLDSMNGGCPEQSERLLALQERENECKTRFPV